MCASQAPGMESAQQQRGKSPVDHALARVVRAHSQLLEFICAWRWLISELLPITACPFIWKCLCEVLRGSPCAGVLIGTRAAASFQALHAEQQLVRHAAQRVVRADLAAQVTCGGLPPVCRPSRPTLGIHVNDHTVVRAGADADAFQVGYPEEHVFRPSSAAMERPCRPPPPVSPPFGIFRVFAGLVACLPDGHSLTGLLALPPRAGTSKTTPG